MGKIPSARGAKWGGMTAGDAAAEMALLPEAENFLSHLQWSRRRLFTRRHCLKGASHSPTSDRVNHQIYIVYRYTTNV